MTDRMEEIFDCYPYASVVETEHRESRCDFCLKLGFSGDQSPSFDETLYSAKDLDDKNLPRPTKLQKCSGCKLTFYCSKKCQKDSWKAYHKIECRCLSRSGENYIPRPEARLLLRIIIRSRNNADLQPNSIRTFNDLISHKENIEKDMKRMDEFKLIIDTLKVFTDSIYELPTPEELLTTFGKMVINTFSIIEDDITLGSGLYLDPSGMDHSCKPSALCSFAGARLRVFKLDERPSTISYIDILQYSTERIEQLEKAYYFNCQCELCSDEQLLNSERGFKCRSSDCDGYIERKNKECSKCDSQMDNNVFQESLTIDEKVGKLICEKYEINREDDCSRIYEICANLLNSVRKTYYKLNRRLAAFHRLYIDVSIGCGKFEELYKSNIFKEFIDSLRLFYGSPHSTIGMILYKQAKIEEYLGELNKAREHYYETLDEFIPYNNHSKFILELMLKTSNLEIEIERLGNIDSWTKRVFLVQTKRTNRKIDKS
ncbi:DgyrCDS9737 [Dimorphilus gyrociliatus]|uniref:DgyrCDS9737 n=1 Tax=Dimorphilus gyrociliatus TaxID=2664684 RepID=A0A7I8VXU9_9ANNE|nr:DgyrCDS9737 [Dimorphilus gyrociliatus]